MASDTFWLIERGQAEGLDRPVYLGTYGSRTKWTPDVTLAIQFRCREDADLFMGRRLEGTGITARVVEHGWLAPDA